MMIVPGAREQTMIAELSRRMIEADITFIEENIMNEEIVWCTKVNLGPTLVLTSWPRIIEFLKKESGDNSIAQNDLSYCSRYVLLLILENSFP
jgi:hypothetical protein